MARRLCPRVERDPLRLRYLPQCLHSASPLDTSSVPTALDIHTVRDEADKTDNHAAVRCPLCIGNHRPVALPPPSAPIVERGLSHTTSVGMLDGVFVALARISDHHARGPPLLT